MRVNVWQDTSRANWVDYLLCWLSSAFAVFSCGQAVNSMMVSNVGLLGVTLGVGFSYLIRTRFEGKAFARIDGVVYAIVAWTAVIAAKTINASVFPEDTFPPELTPSAWLLWMTIFGSFFCWRDGTLIFQAIPALAIFGFVGCYDTFRYVVFFFFLFLICFATLFARAHGRDMQIRAVESGFFRLSRGHNLSGNEQSASLREGPWRWAAGAEWALGSALVIVILSLIGAPVIQATAKPISGIVTVRAPRIRNNTALASAVDVPTNASVGNGPVSLSDTPTYEVSGDVPEYLKVASFGVWSGKSWSVAEPVGRQLLNRKTGAVIGSESDEQLEKLKYPNKKPGEFWDTYRNKIAKVRALVPTKEVLQAGNNPSFACGKIVDSKGPNLILSAPDRYEGTLIYDTVPQVLQGSNSPKIIDSSLNAYLDNIRPSDLLKALASRVTKGLSSDFEKATALKAEIARQIKYNIKAAATPDGKDPSEYALFESHEGYCDVFATSMVRMARILRIPARYTIGYLPDAKNRNDLGTQIVLESDRHAWAELYFEGIGWVTFDATEGAEVVPGGGRHDNKPTDSAAILRMIGNVLNVLIVGAALVGAALYFRMRRLPKTTEMIRSEFDQEYVKFIGAIWKQTGHRRLLNETTNEYLKRVGGDLGGSQVEAMEIGVRFTNAMFGPTEIAPTDVESIRQSVQHFRDELNQQAKGSSKAPFKKAVVNRQESS